VPAEASEYPDFKQIAVAWNGTPQTARAIRNAMPLLKRANVVRVVCVGVQSNSGPEQINGSDVAKWLAHHDINTILDEHRASKLSTGSAMINDVSAAGADLLVFGGYGHSPLYDVVLGGVTNDVINNSEIPVLLSH
jgi:nucleotide-binding universal stress UspA family protein